MRFTLRQLEYFLAAAHAKSITDAAARARISPASVSTAISHLEQEFDVKLFVRHHAQGLVLTAAGQQFAARAQALLDMARGFYDDAHEHNAQLRGELTVGCFITLAPLILPEICQTFLTENPEAKLNIFEGNQDELIGGLRREEIDVALTYDMQLPDDVAFVCLVKLPPCLLVPSNHHLARRRAINIAEIEGEPFILLDLPYSRDYFQSLFDQAAISPNIVARSRQPGVIRTMVANGYGVTITVVRPKNRAAADGKVTVSIPLKGGVGKLPLGMVSLPRSHLSQLLSAFQRHVRNRVSERRVPGMAL